VQAWRGPLRGRGRARRARGEQDGKGGAAACRRGAGLFGGASVCGARAHSELDGKGGAGACRRGAGLFGGASVRGACARGEQGGRWYTTHIHIHTYIHTYIHKYMMEMVIHLQRSVVQKCIYCTRILRRYRDWALHLTGSYWSQP